jgi:hypothetical protein
MHTQGLENISAKPRPFIRAQVAIESMRDNGFLSAAHAIAELIDNSVQAGASLVEIFAFEKRAVVTEREMKRVDRIAIFDNGCGMSRETLHLALEFGASENREDKNGIGKFGMGLPNASISQCCRVEVWSWVTRESINYTYLDIEEIKQGCLEEIPLPTLHEIPQDLLDAIGEPFPKTGTIVLWSKIDRCQWKTTASIRKHTEDIVGRMYRYFINNDQLTVRFKSFESKLGVLSRIDESEFKANDPLYLMKNTSLPNLPDEYVGESFFKPLKEEAYQINDQFGSPHFVTIKSSIVKQDIADKLRKSQKLGGTEWGKHAHKNNGVSIVRAGRELELTKDLFDSALSDNKYQTRFIGLEISFPPALDVVLGVTNNKQHAVNLKLLNMDDDYASEGFSDVDDYKKDLEDNENTKLQLYTLSGHIREHLKSLKAALNGIKVDSLNEKPDESIQTREESLSQTISKLFSIRDVVTHEISENNLTESDIEKLMEPLVSKDEAKRSAKYILEHKLKASVVATPMNTDAFFDVTISNGFTLIQINESHSFIKRMLNQVPDEQKDILMICFAAWARMEKESPSEQRRELLGRIRKDWGVLLEEWIAD